MMFNQPRGFTLIETLVAITILTLAIIAPFQAVQAVLLQARIAQEELTASSLAQEGLEYVRFIRTSNYLNAYQNGNTDTYDPMSGLDGNNQSLKFGSNDCEKDNGNVCTVDTSLAPQNAIQWCSAGISSCGVLYVRTATGIYSQAQNGTATPFTRYLSIKKHANWGYETATVTVSWNDHGGNQVVLSENFYDWL